MGRPRAAFGESAPFATQLSLSLLLPLSAAAIACVRACAGEASVCGRGRHTLAVAVHSLKLAPFSETSPLLTTSKPPPCCASWGGHTRGGRQKAGRPRAAFGESVPPLPPHLPLSSSLATGCGDGVRACVCGGGKRVRAWETHQGSLALSEACPLQRDAATVEHDHTSSGLRELGREGISGEGVSERERAGRR